MKFILTTLGVLLISASSYAWPEPFKIFGNQGSPVPSRLSCANFTGTWSGTCNVNGVVTSTYPLWISQNGCETMYVNGNFYALGGSRSESHTIPNRGTVTHYQATTNFNWLAGTSLESLTNVETHNGNSPVYSDRIRIISSLAPNGHMTTQWNSNYSQGTCAYQRVY